jgi:hypothetical protein
MVIAIIAMMRLAALIWAVIAYHRVHWYNAFAPTVILGLVVWFLLFDENARRFFERS